MLTIIGLYRQPRRGNEEQGERSFWAWPDQGHRYLSRFLNALVEHMPQPWRLVLLVDFEPVGWSHPLLSFARLTLDAPGWWNKLEMFRPDVSEGRCLYLDLDNVISGDMGPLVSLPHSPLIMADDRAFPGLPNGSVMLFDADRLRFLWDEYRKAPTVVREEFSEAHWPSASDQAFIADRVRKADHEIPLFQDLLPAGFLLMAQELERGADWSTTRIVCGQSVPKPHQSTHPFYQQHWRDAA